MFVTTTATLRETSCSYHHETFRITVNCFSILSLYSPGVSTLQRGARDVCCAWRQLLWLNWYLHRWECRRPAHSHRCRRSWRAAASSRRRCLRRGWSIHRGTGRISWTLSWDSIHRAIEMPPRRTAADTQRCRRLVKLADWVDIHSS